MSNDFYNNESNTLTNGSTAKASDVEAKFDEVVTAFAKLPGEDALNRGTINFADNSGTTTALAVALSQAPTAYVDGMEVVVQLPAANTGACTINVNSLGAKSIKRNSGDDVSSGNFPANSMIHLRYDADNDYFLVIGSSAYEDRLSAIETSINGALTAGSGCPVSENDTSAGYLSSKLVKGTSNVTLTLNNSGANETLSISVDTSLSNDTSPELSEVLNGGGFRIRNCPVTPQNIGAVASDQTLDASEYNYFRIEPTADIGLDITNIGAGTVVIIELLGAGDHTFTHWKVDGLENLVWDGESEPSWVTGVGTSFAGFISPDGVKLVGVKSVNRVSL